MWRILFRLYEDLDGRVGGPMTFRLVLQPTIATLAAIRAGLRDAREGRPAYFWTLLTDRAQRFKLLREGWRAIFTVFILAVIMDVIYEFIVLGWINPFENLLVATLLAVVPYLLTRGPVNRLARRARRKGIRAGKPFPGRSL
jgi:hypothetical protein